MMTSISDQDEKTLLNLTDEPNKKLDSICIKIYFFICISIIIICFVLLL